MIDEQGTGRGRPCVDAQHARSLSKIDERQRIAHLTRFAAPVTQITQTELALVVRAPALQTTVSEPNAVMIIAGADPYRFRGLAQRNVLGAIAERQVAGP